MVITIDGPAGTGKSTVALAVAQRLGFAFLDTGAMYRAVGLAAIRRKSNQGSVVFPHAEFKYYLDAKPEERAKRRVAQLRSRGEIVDYKEILSDIVVRDHRDASRRVGPLAVPADAVVVDTTQLSEAQVVDRIVSQVRARQAV